MAMMERFGSWLPNFYNKLPNTTWIPFCLWVGCELLQIAQGTYHLQDAIIERPRHAVMTLRGCRLLVINLNLVVITTDYSNLNLFEHHDVVIPYDQYLRLTQAHAHPSLIQICSKWLGLSPACGGIVACRSDPGV